ncbi:hypothetical protein PybrP1_012074 [[Pythium] brassicae (nom. inval.)]|nr:hypothetical protein PybrP1_012074 [[Pythium] brassicae (nom. inval.)]
MPALVRSAVRFALGKGGSSSKHVDAAECSSSRSNVDSHRGLFRLQVKPLSSSPSTSSTSTSSSSTPAAPFETRDVRFDSETESEPEPLPYCSCDEFYLVRCEYHQGEHHGLSFEIASEFVDLRHLLHTIADQELRRYVFKNTQVGKLMEYLTLKRFPVTTTQLGAITKLMRDRLSHISSLHFVDSLDAGFVQRHRGLFREFLTTAFAVQPVVKLNSLAAALPEETRGLMKELAFQECPMDNAFFAAVGSALHYSNAVTTLDLQQLLVPERVPTAELTLCWAWLAFGLFHPNSTAKVSSLDLSRNMLRMEDIRMVEGIMSGGHPAHVLLIPEYTAALRKYSAFSKDKILHDDIKRILLKSIPQRRMFALIKENTTARPLPTAHIVDDGVFPGMIKNRELLEVFCLLNKWLCVVVPGFGLAWLPRSSVLELSEVAMSPRVCSPASLLKSATFWNMIESHEAEGMVVPLVTLFCQMSGVSEHLESLNLSGNRVGTPEAFGIPASEILRRVLHSSPYLTSLNLSNCQLTDITALVDAYNSGECRIKNLNLDSNELGFRGAFDLAMLLINDDHACDGTWLTSLSLLFNNIDAIGVRALLEALQYNVHLEHLALEYGNTFPPELGDVEFTGDSRTWHEGFLFERLAVLRVFEQRLPDHRLDEVVMENMWELLGFQ